MIKIFGSWTYETLEAGSCVGWPRRINLALMLLVILSVQTAIMETVEWPYAA